MLAHIKAVKIAATTAVALGAIIGAAGPALAVNAPTNCTSGKVCIYSNINYAGPNSPGKFSGDNSNFGTDFAPAGFWNDSVSSAYNNLSPAHQVALFANIDGVYGESPLENFSFCINYHDNTATTQNLGNVIVGSSNFNDQASSDVVYTGSSSWCGKIS